tara:strand:+ start:131 stop:1030 length:900 start_codon:yes stop_codon:yes gene_type:complete
MIEAKNVIKKYGAVTALDDFTVNIPEGKIGILGPNGAGKSTFVKIALGLIGTTNGNVTVLGEKLTKNSIEIRKRIGYMPEHDCVPNSMTGIEFLIEMGECSGMGLQVATQRSHEILNHLKMGDEKYRKISEYSGGMRQKIKLAQGLIHGPDLIFLDEPTSGLDPNARNEMLDTINGLTKVSNTNVLLSTHILQDVETVCDQVIIVNEGKLQLQESVESLMKRQTDIIQVRIGDNKEKFIKTLKDKKITVRDNGRSILVDYKNENTFDNIIASAVKNKCQLYEMERMPMTMDNIYLEVVK